MPKTVTPLPPCKLSDEAPVSINQEPWHAKFGKRKSGKRQKIQGKKELAILAVREILIVTDSYSSLWYAVHVSTNRSFELL